MAPSIICDGLYTPPSSSFENPHFHLKKPILPLSNSNSITNNNNSTDNHDGFELKNENDYTSTPSSNFSFNRTSSLESMKPKTSSFNTKLLPKSSTTFTKKKMQMIDIGEVQELEKIRGEEREAKKMKKGPTPEQEAEKEKKKKETEQKKIEKEMKKKQKEEKDQQKKLKTEEKQKDTEEKKKTKLSTTSTPTIKQVFFFFSHFFLQNIFFFQKA